MHAPITIGLTSPWTPPYINESSFIEQDVSANAGWLTAIKGTLTIPRKSGPHPAVIMLPGSGDGDRDVSVGAIKPGKDLAWGLSKQRRCCTTVGKPLLRCALKVLVTQNLTINDEYMPHNPWAQKA
jgi:hypothetical protein